MRWTGPDGKVHVAAPPAVVSPLDGNLIISAVADPWRIYGRMMMTVIPAFLLLYLALLLTIGILQWDPILIIAGGTLSIPPVLFILKLTRPPVFQLWRATPNPAGTTLHNRPQMPALTTPIPTNMSRHLALDSTPIEFPPSWGPWALFGGSVLISLVLSLIMAGTNNSLLSFVIFGLMSVPLWLVGFSVPVLAWWSLAGRRLKLHIKRVEAEAWLIAGMMSAFPAFLLNSLLLPELIPPGWDSFSHDLATVAIGAPVIEELSKASAILIFSTSLKGRSNGFMIGFSVGLGFGLIENLQYIAVALFGGPVDLATTTLVRGVGSIPAHALWTAIVGSAIGGYFGSKEMDTRTSRKIADVQIHLIDKIEGLGFDLDGDGLLEGYRGDVSAISNWNSDGHWTIKGTKQEVIDPKQDQNDGRRSIMISLVAAMIGHSIWNALSLSSIAISSFLSLGDVATIMFVLSVVCTMVTAVIVITLKEIKNHSGANSGKIISK